MNKLAYFLSGALLLFCGTSRAAVSVGVLFDEDTHLVDVPSDFWTANSNLIVSAIGGAFSSPGVSVHASTHAPGGSDALTWTQSGTTGSRPAAAAGNAGYLYYNTTTATLQRSDGSTWSDVALNDADLAVIAAAAGASNLVGSGDTTLHYHAADRARANHTGTQAWSTLTSTPTTRAGYGITDVPLYTELLDDAPTNSSFYGRLGGAWSIPAVANVTGLQTALDNRQATNGALTTLATLNGSGLTNLNGAAISSGQIPIARMATGTPDGTKFVRDDGTLASPGGGGVPAAGVFGSAFMSTGSATNWYTFRRMDRIHDDLDWGAVPVSAGTSWAIATSSGAGAAGTIQSGETNATGVVRSSTGTTATGWFAFTFGQTLLFGTNNIYEAATRIKLPVLSSATERYFVHAGFYDAASTNATDGAYFQYVHDANSGNFTYVCRSNAVTTASANGTVGPAADTWVSLRVMVDVNAGNAYFYVNDVLDATVAGPPTGAGRYTAFRVQIEASGGSTGTGADLMDVDYADRTILYGVTR